MKKKNIIKDAKDFNRIIKKRNGVVNKYFIVNSEDNLTNDVKFGITFTKNIGNAVTRNKLKRRVKAIIDNNKNIYDFHKNYIIIIRKDSLFIKYADLERELISLFNRIKGEIDGKK